MIRWHPAAAEIGGLYERHAGAWAKARTGEPFFEQSWLDRFRAVAAPESQILDLGCGAGSPIAAYFLQAGHRLTGVDSSPSMIEMCRRHFPLAKWIVADMRHLALEAGFGGIVAWDSFFHLTPDDQRAMFPIFRAHATPGAALMFTSGPEHGEAVGILEGESLYHGSLSAEEYRALLNDYDFDVLHHVAEDASCGHRTIWLAKSR